MYIDAYIDNANSLIHVVERVNGKRIFKEYPVDYNFYYKDNKKGKYESIYGDRLSKFSSKNIHKFNEEKAFVKSHNIFESDNDNIFSCLYNNYYEKDNPQLNVMFFDIEVDFDKKRGFAPPDNPFNPVISISLYLTKINSMITLLLKNDCITEDMEDKILDTFENTILFDSEKEMLESFLELLQNDNDIISGWNSDLYDIPYLVNRIRLILGESYTKKFCLWNKSPKKKTVEKFGKKSNAYDLYGIVHLDYYELYRKYTYHDMHSYSLDAISEYELGDRKTEYDGTLDKLYNEDIMKFIEYNRKDVELLLNLDTKLKFIDLTNVIAHSNTVLLQTTLGSVRQIDQAIINEIHNNELICKNRNKKEENVERPAGAFVADPVPGLHKWVGSMDINSLYPNIIRALNMSNETIYAQIRHDFTDKEKKDYDNNTEFWEGKFACEEYELVMKQDEKVTLNLDYERGRESEEMTGKDIYDLVFNSKGKYVLSSNGTIFTTDKEGIIPAILDKWYQERKVFQQTKKNYLNLSLGIKI